MTITQVPSVPIHTELKTYDVDKTIAARHVSQLISNTSFLLGKNVENVVCSFPSQVQMASQASSTPTYHSADYEWFYTRSPDVKYVVVSYETHKSTPNSATHAYDMRVTASFPAGTFFPTATDDLKFRNNYITDQRIGRIEFTSYTGVCDVSALPTGSASLFKLTITGINATATSIYAYPQGGISKISMQELPQRYLTISQTEMTGSSDGLYATPYRRIVDGTANTEYGLARMLDQTKVVRSKVRNQWQIINHQQLLQSPAIVNPSWWYCNTGTESPLLFQLSGESLSLNDFNIRTRNYDGYTGTEVNKYKLYVRYRTEDASPGSGCYLKLNYASEPNNRTGSVTLNLPASTAWTTASTTVDLPCDEWIFQREQLVRLNFRAQTTGSTQVIYVSAIYLVEEEA